MDGYLVSDRAKLAKTGAISPAAPTAYQGTQNQWPAGYGVQPQTWPQATQAQGQQWPATYTQQVFIFGNRLLFKFVLSCACVCSLLKIRVAK